MCDGGARQSRELPPRTPQESLMEKIILPRKAQRGIIHEVLKHRNMGYEVADFVGYILLAKKIRASDNRRVAITAVVEAAMNTDDIHCEQATASTAGPGN